MNKKVENAIKRNDNLDENMKKVVIETFSRIYAGLEKDDFLRWLREADISERVQRLIFKICDRDEDEYLNKHPNVTGRHTYSKDGSEDIVIDKDGKHIEKTSTHETMHMASQGNSKFGRFIDEGLTEYITGIIEGQTTSYSINVKFAELMHSIFGDKFIKAYLTSNASTFYENEARELCGKDATVYDIANKRAELKNIESKLNEYHTSVYGEEKNTDNSRENVVEAVKSVISIFVEKEKKKIDELEYYKDGKVDFEKFTDQMSHIAMITSRLGATESIPEAVKSLMHELIENSHLLVGLKDKEREEVKEKIFGKLKEQYNLKVTGQRAPKINQSEFADLNEESLYKLVELKMTRERLIRKSGQMDMEKYFDTLSDIKRVTGCSDRAFSCVLSKVNIDLSQTSTKEFDEMIKKVFPMYDKLRVLEKQREGKTVQSDFIRISDSILGEGAYIEKRDNQFFVVRLGEKDEKISEVELKEYGNFQDRLAVKNISSGFFIDKREWLYKDNTDFFDNNTNIFELENMKNRGSMYLAFNEDMKECEIIGRGKTSCRMTMSEMKQQVVSEIITQEIINNIKAGKYTEILEDKDNPEYKGAFTERVDYRNRRMNVELFTSDISRIMQLIPCEGFESRIEELAYKAIDRAYLMKTIPSRDSKGIYTDKIRESAGIQKRMAEAVAYKVLGKSKRRPDWDKNTVERVTAKDIALYESKLNDITGLLKPNKSMALRVISMTERGTTMSSVNNVGEEIANDYQKNAERIRQDR